MKHLLFACFLIVFASWFQPALSEVLVSETFDDGVFGPEPKYCCSYSDSPLPLGPGDCSECSNRIEHVTDIKYAGTYALKCVYNEKGAAGIVIKPSEYDKKDFGRNVYIRLFIKWDQGFRFYNRVKLWRFHSPGNDPYLNVNGCEKSGYGAGGSRKGTPYGDIGFYSSDAGTPEFKYVSVKMQQKGYDPKDWVVTAGDDWWMVEVHLYQDGENPKFDLWVQRPEDNDPVLVYENVTQPNMGVGPFGELDINWINDVKGNSGGTFWIDEIILSDQYIGLIKEKGSIH